ncbi:hypothetical protein [Halothiobacillus sp.]|uniref:hypothetical protein n=1 Tax=Halothiobacillus sp. TaxID=1891311 RepID=UPI002AD2A5DA|nr:hypothetical protein [Halothiobacillus sp.]
MTTQTQTTAQALAAGLKNAEQAVAALQAQRSGILAKIVAGELKPAALDDHDAEIAHAVADAERRREIATAADAESKRQRREAARQSDLDHITALIDGHSNMDRECMKYHAAFIQTIKDAQAALDGLRSAQKDRAHLAQSVEHMIAAFQEQWPDDAQPKRPRLSQAGISDRARLMLQVPSPSVYTTADTLEDPLRVTV